MRLLALPLAMLLLAGCLAPAAEPLDDGALREERGDGVRRQELYDGALVTVNAAAARVSPDQLGAVEREFHVHTGTRAVTLTLDTSGGDLTMHLDPPGCHESPSCQVTVGTVDGKVVHVLEAPEVGPWGAHFVRKGPGAGEVKYALHVEKHQDALALLEEERLEGKVVAAHLGAIRISPDQLGEVYREFWVPEGTRNLTLHVEASAELHFVVGQSKMGRDRESERGNDTKDGRLHLEYADPKPGGWYVIFFHTADGGPGVKDITYTVDVRKIIDAPAAGPASS